MAELITRVGLPQSQIGDRVKASFVREGNIYENGTAVPARFFRGSSKKHVDFEIIVLDLRNSELFQGKQEVMLTAPSLGIRVSTNKRSGRKEDELVLYAKRLKVVK